MAHTSPFMKPGVSLCAPEVPASRQLWTSRTLSRTRGSAGSEKIAAPMGWCDTNSLLMSLSSSQTYTLTYWYEKTLLPQLSFYYNRPFICYTSDNLTNGYKIIL